MNLDRVLVTFHMKIHFIGINGSGIIGVACIAKSRGFEISGCDINKHSSYSKQLEELGIDVKEGHNPDHITNDVDLVVITPALLYKNKWKEIPEVVKAFNEKKTITWQEFMGTYIMKDKDVVAVCGTHGKTSITTLTSLVFEKANCDPTCSIGGIVKEWGQTYRIGKSDLYIIEADEYNGNFLKYFPKYVVFNNLEMEHPEFFKDFEDYKNMYSRFLHTIQNDGAIFFNYDDENSIELIRKNLDFLKGKNVKLFAYTLDENNQKSDFCEVNYIKTNHEDEIVLNSEVLKIKNVFGEHNIKNIALVSLLANKLNVKNDVIQNVLNEFTGCGRRLDLVLSNDKVDLYDDYAHHHTQIKYCLEALRKKYKNGEKIIAIWEPHLISRFENNSNEYISYLELADLPIVMKFFKSRESFKEIPDMDKYFNNTDIQYIEDNNLILEKVKKFVDNTNKKVVILVMGAGNSYKMTEELKSVLSK